MRAQPCSAAWARAVHVSAEPTPLVKAKVAIASPPPWLCTNQNVLLTNRIWTGSDGDASSIMAAVVTNNGCDPFTVREMPCEVGNSITYAVNATDASDFTKAIAFATERNSRLVIRNTGHKWVYSSHPPPCFSVPAGRATTAARTADRRCGSVLAYRSTRHTKRRTLAACSSLGGRLRHSGRPGSPSLADGKRPSVLGALWHRGVGRGQGVPGHGGGRWMLPRAVLEQRPAELQAVIRVITLRRQARQAGKMRLRGAGAKRFET